MRYLNQASATLMLDREDGRGPQVQILPGAYLDASSKYDNAIYQGLGLVRVPEGTTIATVAGNPMPFAIGRCIKKDSLTANTADEARFSGVTFSGLYTCWGCLYWTDAGGDRTADFTIKGNGVHGSGATFDFETVGGAVYPVAAASQINTATGEMQIAFNSGLFRATFAKVEMAFDYDQVSVSAYYGLTEAVMSQPCTQSRIVYVQAADVADDPANYSSGSEGEIKEERIFMTGTNVGDMCRVTKYYYRDTTYPSKYTNAKTTMELVVAADLA